MSIGAVTARFAQTLKANRLVLLTALLVGVASFVLLLRGGMDWREDIAPGAQHWWAPWEEGLPLAPWSAFLFWVPSRLPPRLATAAVNASAVIIIGALFRAHRIDAKWAVLIALTPFACSMYGNAQTDALLMLGLLLPRGFGLPVLIAKPQIGFGAIFANLHKDRWQRLLPLACVFLLSLALWGFWPIHLLRFRAALSGDWNGATWPYGIPVGIAMLAFSWWKRDEEMGVMASQFLSPYVNLSTYVVTLTMLVIVAHRYLVRFHPTPKYLSKNNLVL
jgi:hypothetical protein